MRYLILFLILTEAATLKGQNIKPQSFYVSYYGEMVTHPGLRMGIIYQLKSWEKAKIKRSGNEKIIQRSINLSPSIGIFYHKDYQTGLYVLPELSYSRKNDKGNYLTYSIGTGYMRTFIPNVYDHTSTGEVEKIHAGYNYFITNYSITFGKELSINENMPVSIYLKPQLLYAIPNYSKGIKYFALELGVNYRLR